MEPPGPADLIEFAAQLRHAIADQATVRLDLRFAWTPEESEAATLPLEVGPAAHETAGLIIEMRQFDLKPSLRGGGTLAEYLQDQPRPVDHLRLQRRFEVALLHRAERSIEDHQSRIVLLDRHRELVGLTAADQRRRPRRANLQRDPVRDDDPDRRGETCGLGKPRLRITFATALIGQDDNCPCPAGELIAVAVEPGAQLFNPRPYPPIPRQG